MRFSLSMFPVDGEDRPDPLAELIREIDQPGVRVRLRGEEAVVEGERREVEEAVARAQSRVLSAGGPRFALLLVDASRGPAHAARGGKAGLRTILTRPGRN